MKKLKFVCWVSCIMVIFMIPQIACGMNMPVSAANVALSEEDISFISADSYRALADGTKIAVIASDTNSLTYTFMKKKFAYSENLGGYVAIVDDHISAKTIASGISVTNEPTEEVEHRGDVNGDGNIRSADAAFANYIIHNPNRNYSDMARLRAEVMAGKTVAVTMADVYYILRAAIGLNTTEADIPDFGDEFDDPVESLPEDQWVKPAVLSFASEAATALNASVKSGEIIYRDGGAILKNFVAPQFNSPAYVLDNHLWAAVYYKTSSEGIITFNGTEIAADTSVSAGEWVYAEPVKLTRRIKAAFSKGEPNVIAYTGEGELCIGGVILFSDIEQIKNYVFDKTEPEATVKPHTWVLASSNKDADNVYVDGMLQPSKEMIASDVEFYVHSENPQLMRGSFAFDTVDGVNCLRLERGTDDVYGNFRVIARVYNYASIDYTVYKYARIKYYVSGLDGDYGSYFRITNNGDGSASYADTYENLYENQGKWTMSQVLDLTERVSSNFKPTEKSYSIINRLDQDGPITIGLINAPDNAKVYIASITYYQTKEQAYADASMGEYEPKYLDAKLGKFTVSTVFDGDGMGKWSYSKQDGFKLTDSGDSNNGGNYRMTYKFVFHATIGENRYMRAVYKANNGSATEPVSLVTYSPKTGDTAVIESNVSNTDEWKLSNAVLLTDDLFERLGGTGAYLENQTFENIMQEHNFLAFTNTASDAEYAIRDIYFFDNEDDALMFTMPEAPEAPTSKFTVGNTVYLSTVEIDCGVDSVVPEDEYRIYVQNDCLYVRAGSVAAADFAKKVASGRVLGYDTYSDVLNTTVAADFVYEGKVPVGEPSYTVELKYDDRYTFDKPVAAVESLKITSTSVLTGETDASIIKRVSGETFAVSGIGTAVVYFTDGTSARVNTTPANISLVMIAGQSNGEGHSGDNTRSLRSAAGQVYSTYASAGYRYTNRVLGQGFTKGMDALSIYNNDVFIPKALTGTESRVGSDLTYLPSDLTVGGHGKGGTDSGIAYEWSRSTGEKIWIVNASHSASGIDSWQPGNSESDNNFWQAVGVFQSAQMTVKAEIAAGHYKLSKMGYFWLQGCSDSGRGIESYTSCFKNVHEGFKKYLAFDHDSNLNTPEVTMDFAAIMLVRAGEGYNEMSDYRMNGPRVSQYYMGNEKSEKWAEDVYLVSNITDIFKTDDAVAAYYTEKYGTSENYKADNGVSFEMPMTVDEVHPDIHYAQAGYNEIGRDAAYNLLRQIGVIKVEDTSADGIRLIGADGFEIDAEAGLTIPTYGYATIVPDVYPRYMAVDVTVEYSDNIIRDDHYNFICKDGKAAYITFRCGNVSQTININS